MDKISPFLHRLYGSDVVKIGLQTDRFQQLERAFVSSFDRNPEYYFSTPGRAELGGNHTDHNHGRVLAAAAIDLDMVAVAAAGTNSTVTIFSEGCEKPFVIDLQDLSVHEDERGTTKSIIRGVAASLKNAGHRIGGFDACLSSDVLPGSGLSSSAAVEVLLATIFNALFNDGTLGPEEMAKAGQYAESVYFGKPCGLMDQMAIAIGGVVAIDFQDPQVPRVQKLDIDFKAHQVDLIIVDTGGNHSDLVDDYAAIPSEMKDVANCLGSATLRDVDTVRFFNEMPELRRKAGDRAILRALHFIEENDRVARQAAALSKNDIDAFIRMARESGDSSSKRLQNVYSPNDTVSQGVALALSLTEKYLAGGINGACRVHGGGFAGTILVLLPSAVTKEYTAYIEKIFGPRSARVLAVRSFGTAYCGPFRKS